MPIFTIVHNRQLTGTWEDAATLHPLHAAGLSPSMDVLAQSTGEGGGLSVTRWVSWQRVFSVADIGGGVIDGGGVSGDGSGGTSVRALRWSADGAALAVLSGDGSLSLIATAQEAAFAVQRKGDAGARAYPGALSWAVLTAPITGSSGDDERNGNDSIDANARSGGVSSFQSSDDYVHRLPRTSPTGASVAALAAWQHGPEPLPRSDDDAATPTVSFSSVDADALTAVFARGARAQTAADVAFSERDDEALPGGAGTGPLSRAALAVARASESLSLGGSAGEAVGVAGACSEPRPLLGVAASASALTAPTPLPILLAPGGRGLRILAHGTMPLFELSTSSRRAVFAAAAIDPSLCAAAAFVVEEDDEGGGGAAAAGSSVNLCVWRGGAGVSLVPSTAIGAVSALALGDAAVRSAARAVAFAALEWGCASASLTSCFNKLATALSAAAPSRAAADRAARAAARAWPHAPVATAAAELWRVSAVGATPGGGFSTWLETGTGGDVGLVRLARIVEAALASVEALIVVRAVPALEILIGPVAGALADAAVRAPALTAALGQGAGAVASFAERAIRMLEQLTAVRVAAAHARAVYAALFCHLRGLRKSIANAGAVADGGAMSAEPPILADSDAALLQSALQPEGQWRHDRDSEWDGTLDSDSCGGSSGDEEGSANDVGAAVGGAAGLRSSSAAADPLGLGIFGGSAQDDPLGLGFSTSPSSPPPGSRSSVPSPAPASTRLPAAAPFDACLSFSLESTLGTAAQVASLRALLTTPMADYAPASEAPAIAVIGPPSVAAALQNLVREWMTFACASPRALSAAVSPAQPAARFVYSSAAASRAAARASLVFFDDRSLPPSLELTSEGAAESSAAGGALLCVLPLPRTAAASQRPRHVLLLRISTCGSGCGVVVELPPGARLLSTAPYSPLPGALAAAALAVATTAGAGYIARATLGSDDARSIVALLWTPDESASTAALSVARIDVRAAPWAIIPPTILRAQNSDGKLLAEWADAFAPRIELAELAPRVRELARAAVYGSSGWLPDRTGDDTVEREDADDDALARLVALDSAGPRGVAVVLVGPPIRKNFVVDCEDDEDSDEENEDDAEM